MTKVTINTVFIRLLPATALFAVTVLLHSGPANCNGQFVGGQLSVVSCQWSVVRGQLSVVRGPWSIVSCRGHASRLTYYGHAPMTNDH